MSFHFPSSHHNLGGWSPQPLPASTNLGKSTNGSHFSRAEAQTALEYLRKNDMGPRKADQVQPGLYLGDLTSARNFNDLENKRITHVLSACHAPDLVYPSNMRINHKFVDVVDDEDEDLLSHFKECWRYIRDALDDGGRVLVHCEQGISRSATILAAYLMRAERMHPVTALTYIKKFRPIIDPNAGFREQLDVWENCRGELAGQADYIEWKRKMDVRRKA